MKVGRGLSSLVSKSQKIRTSRGFPPVLYTTAPLVLALILLLAGCGQISLNQLLENQEPGELSITPTNATVAEGSTIEITGKGGFKPYTYENKTTTGTLNTSTGEYTAPAPVTGTEDVQIEVTDYFGRKAFALLTIYETLTLEPASKSIEAGGPAINFTASGGVPDPHYDFYLNRILLGSSPGSLSHDFDTPGYYTMEAVDSLGNRAIATITVFANLELAIELPEFNGRPQNWVEIGTSIDLTAVNSSGDHEFSIIAYTEEPGSLPSPPHPGVVAYSAPGSESIVTIQLHDNVDGDTATVEIHVLDSAYVPPPELTFDSTAWVEEGATYTLNANGGINGYTFWIVGKGSLIPHPVHERKIIYEAPEDLNTDIVAYVYVEDGLGRQKVATIFVNAD